MRLPPTPLQQPTSLHSSSASVLSGFSLHCASRASAHQQTARLRLFRYILRRGHRRKLARLRWLTRHLHDETHPRAQAAESCISHPRPSSGASRSSCQDPVNTKSFTAASLPQTPKIARRSSAWRRIANERKLHPKRDPSAPSSTRCWAELLRRTFSHDLLRWQRCSSAAVGEQRGRARVIAAITQRDVIDKILNHTGLGRPCANPASPRAPPEQLSLLHFQSLSDATPA